MNEKSNMDGTMVELINGIEVIRIVDNLSLIHIFIYQKMKKEILEFMFMR